MDKSNLKTVDTLTLFSIFLDLLNYDLNLKTVSNDDIFKELKNQDVNYFERIMEQNNKIIKLLEGVERINETND